MGGRAPPGTQPGKPLGRSGLLIALHVRHLHVRHLDIHRLLASIEVLL